MKWQDRINAAKKKFEKHTTPQPPFFTEEDVKLAVLWITGPLSEHVGKFKMVQDTLGLGPTDLYLLLDHIYFTKGVEEQDFGLAYNCYNAMMNQLVALKNGTDRTTFIKRFLSWKQ